MLTYFYDSYNKFSTTGVNTQLISTDETKPTVNELGVSQHMLLVFDSVDILIPYKNLQI